MESFVIKEEYNLNGTIRKRIRDSLPSYQNDLEYKKSSKIAHYFSDWVELQI